MWIRHGCVGLVCTAARQLDNIDVLCYMLPKLEMYIKQPIIQIREEVHNLIQCKCNFHVCEEFFVLSYKLTALLECLHFGKFGAIFTYKNHFIMKNYDIIKIIALN